MDCKKCNDQMSACIDNELSAPEAKELQYHLEYCISCALEFESLQGSTRFVTGNTRDLEVQPAIWRNVRDQLSILDTRSPDRGIFSFLWANRRLAATAGLVLAIALGVGYWNRIREQESQQAFDRYVNEYIQAREKQERLRKPAAYEVPPPSDTVPLEYDVSNNPFIVTKDTFFDNPFRSEDQ